MNGDTGRGVGTVETRYVRISVPEDGWLLESGSRLPELTLAYETYGRFPATYDTMLVPIWLQVHHLDIDFYEEYYPGEIVTEAQRRHIELWHKKPGA